MDRQDELAKAVSTAGERVGQALTAASNKHDAGQVPREVWVALADAAFELYEAASTAAGEAEGGTAATRVNRPD